jgi:hypothetical protein
MALKISKGQVNAPMRAFIYGPAGVGKTTLAAAFPKPIFFDTEESTNRLNVDRVDIRDWKSLTESVKDLSADPSGYRTLIIDSIDWAERYLIEDILKREQQNSIEKVGGGFGKGFTMLGEHFGRFLASLDTITAKGLHIVFVGHSKVTKISPPDETEGYDKYEPKLTKHVNPLVKEWAECIFFANFQIEVVKGNDGKIKAQGGRERLLYTQPSAAMDAKNRYCLEEFLPMDFSSLAHLFIDAPATQTPAAQAAKVEKKAEQTQKAETPAVEAEAIDYATAEQVSKLETYSQNTVGAPMIQNALELIGVEAVKDLSQEEALELISSIQKAMNATPTKGTKATPQAAANSRVPAHFAEWFKTNSEVLEAAFAKWGWIKPGQLWTDLSHENMDKVIADPAKIAKLLKIAAPVVGGAK